MIPKDLWENRTEDEGTYARLFVKGISIYSEEFKWIANGTAQSPNHAAPTGRPAVQQLGII